MYAELVEHDLSTVKACHYDWDCENCPEPLCVTVVGVADLPSVHGQFQILGFANNKDQKDHIAVVKGNISGQENVLTRIHSACLTGDAIGSTRCDCGSQLRAALEMIEQEGAGIILYMQQEGRGVGLVNKIRAYQLQDSGLDTYDANVHLQFQPDERDYQISACMLKKLDVKSVKLLTNNPDKVAQLQKHGITISERISLELPVAESAAFYMKTKKDRFGHELNLG
jgi:GTP cyclohydrolase II